MIKRIKDLYEKNADRIKEIIRYLIVGGATTLVSMGTYYLCLYVFHIDYKVSNVISWIFAVTFAFFTNRSFVFNSEGNLFLQIVSFFLSRLFSLGVETGSMILMVEWIHIGEGIAKIIAQVVVVILNYVLGKFLVFRKKKK